MIKGNQQRGKKKQGGIVLLVLVIVVALTFTAYFFSSISIVDIKTDKIHKTHNALKQAKQVLLGYAFLRTDVTTPSFQPGNYGYLPCPGNTNGDGNSVGSCGAANTNYLGWFPWRSLGMPPLKDGNGDCLLYAVSSTYKYNPTAGMLNEDTNYGMFQVFDETGAVIQGGGAQDRVVAIVFSAGNALAAQNRNKDPATECGNDINNFSAYLDSFEVMPGDTIDNSVVETVNEDRVDRFVKVVSTTNEGMINDRLITITRDEIWPRAIQYREKEFDIADMSGLSKVRRLTEALARCLASYANDNANSNLPYPAPVNLGGGDYRDNTVYSDDALSYVGRYPFITNVSDGIVPGAIDNSADNNELFEKNFTGPLEFVFPPTGVWQCDSLRVVSPLGPNVDLRTSGSEDRRFWENWKDHIMYVVSERYTPRVLPVDDLIQPRCNDGSSINDGCITFNGNTYAAIVMYSNRKLDVSSQNREAPIANIDTGVVDTKQVISNYIEVVNATGNGQGDYSPDVGGNDLFFCLTDTEPVDVIECI